MEYSKSGRVKERQNTVFSSPEFEPKGTKSVATSVSIQINMECTFEGVWQSVKANIFTVGGYVTVVCMTCNSTLCF